MKKGEFKKGFGDFRKTVVSKRGALRSMRSCKSCKFFYTNMQGTEEICHNNSVTSYDFTEEENGNSYCTYWIPVGAKTEEK